MSSSLLPPRYPSGTLLTDRYRLQERIASGGSSEVYRAEDTQLHRSVALKIITDDVDASMWGRALTEVRLGVHLSSLSHGQQHSHVVPILDNGVTSDVPPRPYFVMPLLTGVTLARGMALRRHENRPFSLRSTVEFIVALADVLGDVHRAGYVHCDLTPRNVCVDIRDGHALVQLLDVGAVRRLDETRPKPFASTAGYAAPELFLGHPIDPRTDVFSAGIMLYEMLTQRPPWPERAAPTFEDHLRDHTIGRAHSLATLRPDLPPDLTAIIDRMLSREVEHRPSLDEVTRVFARHRAPYRRTEPSTPRHSHSSDAHSSDAHSSRHLGEVYDTIVSSIVPRDALWFTPVPDPPSREARAAAGVFRSAPRDYPTPLAMRLPAGPGTPLPPDREIPSDDEPPPTQRNPHPRFAAGVGADPHPTTAFREKASVTQHVRASIAARLNASPLRTSPVRRRQPSGPDDLIRPTTLRDARVTARFQGSGDRTTDAEPMDEDILGGPVCLAALRPSPRAPTSLRNRTAGRSGISLRDLAGAAVFGTAAALGGAALVLCRSEPPSAELTTALADPRLDEPPGLARETALGTGRREDDLRDVTVWPCAPDHVSATASEDGGRAACHLPAVAGRTVTGD